MSRAKSNVRFRRIAFAAVLLAAVSALLGAAAQTTSGTQATSGAGAIVRDSRLSTRPAKTPEAEEGKRDAKESEELTFDTPSIIGIAAVALLLLTGVVWMFNIARRQAEHDRQESARYEAEILSGIGPQAASLMAPDAAAAEIGGGAAPTPESPPSPAAAPGAPAAGAGGPDLTERLEAAGLLKSVEGLLYVGEGDARREARLVELKDGRQALLLDAMPVPAELQKQFRRCELVIVADGDGDPLVVTPFGQLVSGQFRL